MVTREQIREAAEADLTKFIALVAPYRLLGDCHKEVIEWWSRQEAKNNQLLLMPRDHGKSALAAFRAAWEIAKEPCVRIIYMSSTTTLAEKQLGFIKQILESPKFRQYWPKHVNQRESDRAKWTNTEISIDHPQRAAEGIRDATVFVAGLTTNIAGLHCDIGVFDDIVVQENAYTEQGRAKVRSQYSLLNSVVGAEGRQWVVGTRYDPKDLYGDMVGMEKDIYNEVGDVVDKEEVYEVWERSVEDIGDGTGQFLWPRQQRHDGKYFGFSREILAEKRAMYLDQRQFRAQYYNNPNWSEDEAISSEYFQYYNQKLLNYDGGRWFYRDKLLNVVAAIDFAFSTTKKADYTALVVIGIDMDRNIYILDIKRFKTKRISDYYEAILDKHIKWNFRKLRADATSAQMAIVEELKNQYIKPNGIALSVDAVAPTRHSGKKEERLYATLLPRYENLSIWHVRGGNTQILEEELTSVRPPHDDVKDALASAIEAAIPPAGSLANRLKKKNYTTPTFHSRFGGVSL